MSEKSDWLLLYKKAITSQLGEDGILEKIFEILPNPNMWCVEFGAGDGMTYSNTYNLINNHGWSSIQIEANPKKYEDLSSRYTEREDVICLKKIVEFEGENTLDNILSQTDIPTNLDLISIDIDGNDYHIWDSIQAYRPKIVLIEFNPTIPHHIGYIQPKDPNINHGSSLLAMQTLGKKKGYELICSTDWNGIFVDDKYFSLFDIEDNSIWKMNCYYKYWTIAFQTYDGTIRVVGNSRLLWHNIEIDLSSMEEMIQILSPEERQYPQKLS